jgi:hypothetical protein
MSAEDWRKAGYADLMRQGFMKPASKKKQRIKGPIVACEECLDWHELGRHTKTRTERAALKLKKNPMLFWNNPIINPRGIYTGTAAQQDDFVIRQHRTSGRYFVDIVRPGGTHISTAGSAKGYATLPEAMQQARREAHRRGIQAAIIWGLDREGDFHELGHAPKSHQTGPDPNSIPGV